MISKDGMPTRSPRDESTSDLLGGLLSDAKDLITAHGEQMKLEVRGEVRKLKETIAGYLVFRTRPPRADADLIPEESLSSIKRDVKRVKKAVDHH